MANPLLYCVSCKKQKEFAFAVANQEIHATCDCGHGVKFPVVADETQLQKLIETHNAQNRFDERGESELKITGHLASVLAKAGIEPPK